MAPESEPRLALVFLHHFGGSAQTWDAVVGHLRAEYECVTPDIAGFGAASEAAGPYTVGRYAGDVADLVKQLGLERYILVGHSMGGKIALALAARRPAGLAGLVLLAPSPPTPEPMTAEDRAATLAGYGDREAALATIGKITARPLSVDIVARTADDMLRSSGAAWKAWLEGGSRENISSEVGQLTLPALVVSGDEDRVIPAEAHRSETLPHLVKGHFVSLAGVGHLLTIEGDTAVAHHIRDFCNNV